MSAPRNGTQDKVRIAYLELLNFKEEIEMKLAMGITKAKNMWQSTGLATQHPVKLLGGLILGVLLLVGMGLHFAPSYTDEADSPVAISTIGELQVLPENVHERFEVQRVLADMYNHGAASLPDTSESIQERLEVQRVLVDMLIR